MNLSGPYKQSLAILAAAFLILVNALLHAYVYGNRNFREDEVIVVHESLHLSTTEIVRYLGTSNIHPPGWRILANYWVEVFGPSEETTRWLAKLGNLITFALLYQLGKHIGGRRAGLYAIFLLGVYGFASNSMYELRPYPMLILLTTALHLLFYRWIHKPTPALMFAYVFAGVAAIYTHFFSLFVFPAHVVVLVLYTRFERKFWLDTVLMWLFISLSFVGWLLPFMHSIMVSFPGGISYTVTASEAGILTLYDGSKFKPEIIYQSLMLLSPLALAVVRHFGAVRIRHRFESRYMGLFPLIVVIATILIAVVADQFVGSFSLRNSVMLAPLIAICMALGLRLLPTKATLALMALLLLHAPQNIAWQTANAPYREIVQKMAPTYQTDSLVVTEFRWAWRWLLAAGYYLMDFTPDKMSKNRMFHILDPHDYAHPLIYADQFVNVHHGFHQEAFARELPSHRQLWRLSQGGGNFPGLALGEWINQNYALISTNAWDEPFVTSYELSEYAKVPDNHGPMVRAGDELRLYAWELRGSVEVAACQSVTIESWWQLENEAEQSYSLSIILADDDGDGQLAIQDSIPADVFTTEWQADRFYRDRTSLEIPCITEEGRYNLLLAAKETESGTILPLRYPDGSAIGNEFYLTTLHIVSS